MFTEIKDSLRDLYRSDPRPWLVGFSGGKDSTLVAGLIFDEVCDNNRTPGLPAELKRLQRDDLLELAA